MSKTWKWILGIVLGLVVLAFLFHAGFAWRSGSFGAQCLRTASDERGIIPFAGMQRGFGMMPFGHSGVMSFGGLGILGGLFQLGFLTLLVMAIIWFARKLSHQHHPGDHAAPIANCAKCGGSLQAGWKNCPNCGKKI